jgi:hypothetical protein
VSVAARRMWLDNAIEITCELHIWSDVTRFAQQLSRLVLQA